MEILYVYIDVSLFQSIMQRVLKPSTLNGQRIPLPVVYTCSLDFLVVDVMYECYTFEFVFFYIR